MIKRFLAILILLKTMPLTSINCIQSTLIDLDAKTIESITCTQEGADEKWLAAGFDKENKLCIWDIKTQKVIRQFDPEIYKTKYEIPTDNTPTITLSPGNLIAIGKIIEPILFVDINSSERTSSKELCVDLPLRMAFNTTGDLFATSETTLDPISLWSLKSKDKQKIYTLEKNNYVLSVCFTQKNKLLFSQNQTYIYDPTSKKVDVFISASFIHMDINKNGTVLAGVTVENRKNSILLYNIEIKKFFKKIPIKNHITCIKFNTTSKFLLLGLESGQIQKIEL